MEDIFQGKIEGLFSVAVAGFLLLRMEQKLEALNKTLIELLVAVKGLANDKARE